MPKCPRLRPGHWSSAKEHKGTSPRAALSALLHQALDAELRTRAAWRSMQEDAWKKRWDCSRRGSQREDQDERGRDVATWSRTKKHKHKL